MSQNVKRDLQVYYSVDQEKRDYYNFWSDLISELKKYHTIYETKFINSETSHIELTKKEKPYLELKSCDFVIEDKNSGEFWILSNCDQLSSAILTEKDNTFLKKVLFSQYVPDQIVHHVGKNFYKYHPWIYFSYKSFDREEFITKRKTINTLIPKMFFGGSVQSRPILEYIDNSIVEKSYMKEHHNYLEEVVRYKVGLSIGGASVGDLCYRDIEYMALGIPFIKFNYVATLNPPLVPNYHYISVPFEDLPKHNEVFKDRLGTEKHAKLIQNKFDEVIHNENFLEYISVNAKSYYNQFLASENRTKHTIDLLGLNVDSKFLKDQTDDYVPTKQNLQKMQKSINKTTLVTGLWNINRDSLSEGWSRSFNHYLSKLEQLLQVDENLIIFGEQDLEEWVYSKRDRSKTQFIVRSQNWFKNEFYEKIQTIRTNPNWYNKAGWLPESTQAKLEMYNPLVMSKVFLLNDAKIMDSFDSTHLFWIDAGITNTVHPGYFTHDKVLNKLNNLKNITFIAFPYEAENEIHGFDYSEMCRMVNKKIDKVCRGGFFGGPKEKIGEFNPLYYSLMSDTLSRGYMGTEESLFTLLTYLYPESFEYFEIESNGLISKFFEDVKNDQHKIKSESLSPVSKNNLDINNSALYVITFNSPKQFETLIESMIQYDCNFIDKPKKYLLNNSSDESTFDMYEKLCAEYEFVHIKKDNLGICGGRQFIAEHAEANNFDYYFFFEDDMFFYPNKGEVCRNGFNRYVSNFYNNVLQIIQKHNFDFLKFNYSEFFGDNGTQWSWYNVPQKVREEFWPGKNRLPELGLDPNAPRTRYEHIWSHNGIPYVSGEIYYSNWPQVVSRDGNKKMFLDTTWAHPFEQTWMSHIFQETKKDNIKPALLLMTPTEHNRFEFYAKELRKES